MPWLFKKFYPSCIWKGKENVIYLTFDDGPHPEITDFVLHQLLIFKAKASFFCVGKNVVAYPETYSNIIDQGHTIGNHTFSHLNGWKTVDAVYLDDIAEAKKYIDVLDAIVKNWNSTTYISICNNIIRYIKL